MSSMLGRSGKWYCDKILPGGGCIGGLRVPNRKARRIARARETQALRRALIRGEA